MVSTHHAYPVFAIFAGVLMIGGVFISGVLVQQNQANQSRAYTPSNCPVIACALPPNGCHYLKTDINACGCGSIICSSPTPKATLKPQLKAK